MPSVLFVCTANICRSPMAMALMNEKVKGESDEWRVESAGTWALLGEPAASGTLQILSERGIDLDFHRSRPVSRQLLQEFNLILTMEEGQKEALRAEFPEVGKRVYLLTEMINMRYDIHDPIGNRPEVFRDTAEELDFILDHGFEKIRKLAEEFE
jgi:protein-tyrosine phosphatase